jgi:hypothetical protein
MPDLKIQKELVRLRRERTSGNRQQRLLLEQVEQLEAEIAAFKALGDYDTTHVIKPRSRGSKSEATAVIVASDWHYEERVTKESVNGLNAYNLSIAHDRVTSFWQGAFPYQKPTQTFFLLDKKRGKTVVAPILVD